MIIQAKPISGNANQKLQDSPKYKSSFGLLQKLQECVDFNKMNTKNS